MPKPSNVDLLAERRAIAAALSPDEGVSNADAVKALIAERDRLKSATRAAVPPPPPRIPSILTAVAMEDGAPNDDREVLTGKMDGPIDRAHYPGTAQTFIPAPPPANGVPAMSPSQGDLTPNYCRWFLSTNGPAKTREKYGDRIIYLPADIQEAIK